MIKKFNEFVNENISFRNELYNYQDEYEQIDEGFKDFIRKFALTSAIAMSCISAMAHEYVAKNPKQLEKIKTEIQSDAETRLKKYAKVDKECHIYMCQKCENTSAALAVGQQEFAQKFGGKTNVVGTHTIATKSDSGKTLYQCVIVYVNR